MHQIKKKVMIGMSGGVDSSVSAYLLLKQGYDVTGVTMQIWTGEKENGTCCSLSAVEDARRVASKLKIPYYVVNLKKEFDEKVIQYFVNEYLAGRTPNPCIACNRYIKFEELLHKALEMGMDYIATGHYAKVVKREDGRYILKKSSSKKKDQSYVLYNLTQGQLARVLFPLEEIEKEEVRNIAKELGLQVANKPESQDICFVEDGNYGKIITEYSQEDNKEGDIVNTKGEIIGKHKGVFNYTIGQRKGLGIPSNKPLYVLEIDILSNKIVIGDDSESFKDTLIAEDLNWISIESLDEELHVNAKIRYGSMESPATITPLENSKVFVKFDTPQRAITPGQAVVFYNNDDVIGGGIIS